MENKTKPILKQMKKFSSKPLHTNTILVKDSEYGFTLLFYKNDTTQIGDITIYTNTETHEIEKISIAFDKIFELETYKPSWNGLIINIYDKSAKLEKIKNDIVKKLKISKHRIKVEISDYSDTNFKITIKGCMFLTNNDILELENAIGLKIKTWSAAQKYDDNSFDLIMWC